MIVNLNQDRFAHSFSGKPIEQWEKLEDHLVAVASGAAQRANVFGFGEAGRTLGILHDIGKVSTAFQAYIRNRGNSVDHSTAGAREAARRYDKLGTLLAFAIAGHHAGLADGSDLKRRLDPDQTSVSNYTTWRDYIRNPAFDAAFSIRGRQGHDITVFHTGRSIR